MICQNAILSDEYMDYIWKADVNPPAEMDLLPYGVCAQYISPSFSVYYISRKEVSWEKYYILLRNPALRRNLRRR